MQLSLDLFLYKKWADLRTLDSATLLNQTSESFEFICQQINHMVIVEELFRSRLEKKPQPHSATNTNIVPRFDELKTRLINSSGWFLNYLNDLEKERYNEMISFVFADGKKGSMSISEILFHIVNHGSYHRGSIARALDLAGVAHPPDGYGIFIHEVQAERRKNNHTSSKTNAPQASRTRPF